MTSEARFRRGVREWITQHAKAPPAELRDDTPIIEQRIITSLQVLDLILYLEEMRGTPIDVEGLRPGVLGSGFGGPLRNGAA